MNNNNAANNEEPERAPGEEEKQQDALRESDGGEDNEQQDDSADTSVTWDDIDIVDDMKSFIEAQLHRTTVQWDLYDFGMPSVRKIDPFKMKLLEEALKRIPKLQRISINVGRMTPKMATVAAVALSRCPYLEAVDMVNDEYISCRPDIMTKLIRCGLSTNWNTRKKTLKLKNLYLNDKEASLVLAPVAGISFLTEIKCKNCSKGIAKALLDAAAQCRHLRTAKFVHNKRVCDKEWETCIAFSLRNLIGSSQSLQKLELGPVSPDILQDVAVPLSINRSLKELILTGCDYSFNVNVDWGQAGKRVGEIIYSSQSLERLTLVSFKFGNEAWSEIVQALRKNTHLNALYLGWANPHGWPSPRTLPAPEFRNLAHGIGVLKDLRIAGNFLSNDRIKDFKWAIGDVGLESLIISNVESEFACAVFGGLAFNKSLRKLDIEVQNFSEPCTSRMREMLQVNHTLKSLAIRCAGTGKLQLGEISALFENNACHLSSFGLHGVSIVHSSHNTLYRLLMAVVKTKSFKSLNLENSTMDIASFRVLCHVLPAMKFLRDLSFSFPNTLATRDMDDDLLPLLHGQLHSAMTANQSLTSIRVHPFPSLEARQCAVACTNRNRVRLFREDENASLGYLPYLIHSLSKNGSDHSAIYLTLKRNLDVLPRKGSRKRRLLSLSDYSESTLC